MMIWKDMSYNRPEIEVDFRDRLETEPEYLIEEEVFDEFNKANTSVLRVNGRIL